MSTQKSQTASSRELAKAAERRGEPRDDKRHPQGQREAEPELREAIKRGRTGVQDAAKVADLPPERQKAIAESPKPRRAANVAIEEAKSAATLSASGERSTLALPFARLGRKQLPCVAYWKEADNGTRKWFMEAVWYDLNKGDDRKRERH